MKKRSGLQRRPLPTGYGEILSDVVSWLETARREAARSVNGVMTTTYWAIGRRIVDWEQGGRTRAKYGDMLLVRLSADLTRRVGRGFSVRNLQNFRTFYLSRPIRQMASAKSPKAGSRAIRQTASAELAQAMPQFPLPWSHYVRLLSVKNEKAREFYEAESLRNGWSVKQLDRQISSMFYERTCLSKDKAALLKRASGTGTRNDLSIEDQIKDPFVLEFLGLKDEYSEGDLEEALIGHLESFLMEMGDDLAFIGRQRRLRVGDTWYRVDLLFFHRRLRSLVVVDLKVGAFSHADAGQMHLYLNYAAEHWVKEGENPPVGLILCAQKDSAVAKYALDNLPNKVLAAEYRVNLPEEQLLVQEIEKTQRVLATRRAVARRVQKGRSPK